MNNRSRNSIINIYVPNKGATKFTELLLLNIQEQIGENIIVGEFNTPFSPLNKLTRLFVYYHLSVKKEEL